MNAFVLHRVSCFLTSTQGHGALVRLAIDIHLLYHNQRIRVRSGPAPQFVHGHIPPNILLTYDPLVQERRCTPCELVIPLLLDPLVRLDVIPQQLRRLLLLDHAHIYVTARAQVIEDTGLNGVRADLNRLVARAIFAPLSLENGHGSKGARSHGHVRQLVGRAVGVDGEKTNASWVDARDDEVRADVTLVAEEVLFQHGHNSDDARRAAGGEGVEFEVGGDEGGGEFSVSGRAGAGAPDGGRDIVEFFAVLDIGKSLVGHRKYIG